MEIEELQQIIRLLKAEGLTEITVWEGENRLTVRQAIVDPRVTPPRSEEATGSVPDGSFSLTAPLVGTFYCRPTPDDEPFLAPGDIVRPGDVVGIIEAMKVMNEIKAEKSGRLLSVLSEDGTPVEYGQALFIFEPI